MMGTELRQRMRNAVDTVRRPANSLYERNARNVMIDGMGVGLVQGVGTFLSVFLARLGASNVVVGLLTAMPAIAGALLAIPLGQFIGRQQHLILWYARSRLWVLSSYAFTGLVPFLFGNNWAPAVIIAIWAAATIPQTLVNICFTLVMSAVAGPTKRLELMSRRWTTLGISTALSAALAGWALEQISFPLNYQTVFICSFLGGLLSYAFSTNIELPHAPQPSTERVPWRTSLHKMRSMLAQHRSFTQFVASQFVFRFGMAMAIPLFPLYWVRTIGASDAAIGLITTVQSGILLIAYALWTYVARKRGAGTVLLLCTFGLVLYPCLTALTSQVWPLFVYAALAGMFAAGTDLVIFDVLIATAPEEGRGTAIGIYHTTNYIATFVAPLIGAAAAGVVGIGTMLLVAAFLRLLSGLLFLLLGVGREAPQAVKAVRSGT